MRTAIAILGMLAVQAASPAAGGSPAEPLSVDEAFAMSVARGPEGSLSVKWEIAAGYYLNRDRLAARAEDGANLDIETAPGIAKDDPNFGQSEIYYDEAEAAVPQPGAGRVEIVYQGCQEGGICYAPEKRLIDPVTLAVSGSSPTDQMAVEWSTEDVASSPANTGSQAQSVSAGLEISADQGLVQSFLGKGGVPLVLAMFTLFGALLAFTPCVFPIYPILTGALAREGERLTPGRGFVLSSTYVLGLASAFALLGGVAGWSGQNIQLVLQSSWTTGVIAAVFVILALSMFGLFELQLPSAWTNWIARRTGRWGGSTGSIALLGFSSALIVGPCVTAPLAGALIYIAQTGDVMLGAAALFALGIGKGSPLVALGTLGGGVLPRAGAWMEHIKRLFGFLFLATAVWVATPLLPPGSELALWAVLLIGLASFALSASLSQTSAQIAVRGAGGISLIYGAILMVGATAGATDPLRPLAVFAGRGTSGPPVAELEFTPIASAADLQARIASAEDKPTLVYFTADWCVTCRTIERGILPDKGVRQALSKFHLVKADLTDLDKENAELMKQLRVAGPPTMLFFNNSREVSGTRLVGDVSIESLTRSAAQVEMH
ncbi:protein-disulfide reductase DsbD [Pseudaminobacter sp. 19-2017]|uniref:Protein-disulfide reductase DsbD n=2 Tax=Pseudaminobacter soli (ex Zhang et al. 2022) TaxID=2831468 RepID=A0A942I561_9HYPH|nr:protein-disulfide reductase DsbD [Pseudaminobacter soli]